MDIDIHIDIHIVISPNTHPRTIYTIYTIYIYPNIVIRLDIYAAIYPPGMDNVSISFYHMDNLRIL